MRPVTANRAEAGIVTVEHRRAGHHARPAGRGEDPGRGGGSEWGRLAEDDERELGSSALAQTCYLRVQFWGDEDPAMLFMVIETFRNRDAETVYRRLQENRHMMPNGLRYVDSWVEANFDRCFQLMECDDAGSFRSGSPSGTT